MHEGWYCCRFILMRMTVDKFGTGRNLLVYADSVVGFPEGEKPKLTPPASPQVRLTRRDFDAVVGADRGDRLTVVKLGAIWCPPCRLVDRVISQIHAAGTLPEVDFFEVDVDEERALADRFPNQAIPYLLFYYRGKRIRLEGRRAPIVDGGFMGGLDRANLEMLSKTVLERARAGETTVALN